MRKKSSAGAPAHSATRGVTLRIRAPLGRADLPGLFARTCALLDESGSELLSCEVSEVPADALSVEALARVALAARRRGCAVRLSGACAELLALVTLLGLADVLRE